MVLILFFLLRSREVTVKLCAKVEEEAFLRCFSAENVHQSD